MFIVPFGLLVFTPLLVLPTAYLFVQYGKSHAVVQIMMASALLYLAAGLSGGIFVLLVLLLMGLVLGLIISRKWSFATSLFAISSVATITMLLWGCTAWLIDGLTWSELRTAAHDSIGNSADTYAQMGMSQTSIDAMVKQMHELFDYLPYLLPGLVVVGALLLGGVVLFLAYLVFPKIQEKLELRMSLASFQVHWAFAYISIAGLALLVISRSLGEWQNVVLYLGIDMLLISQTVFFYQGLAVVHWFGESRQMSKGARFSFCAVAILGQALFQITGLFGLFDTWINCRKRFVPKTSGSGPVSKM